MRNAKLVAIFRRYSLFHDDANNDLESQSTPTRSYLWIYWTFLSSIQYQEICQQVLEPLNCHDTSVVKLLPNIIYKRCDDKK